jgi:hypothetical protein
MSMMTPRAEEMQGEVALKKENHRLDQRLKKETTTTLNNHDVNTILQNLVNRKRFNYKLSDIMSYLLRCLCVRKLKHKKWKGSRKEWDTNIRKHY